MSQEPPMQTIRRIAIQELRRIHFGEWGGAVIRIPIRINGNFHDVRVELTDVQNTLTYEVFGAFIRIENYFIADGGDSAEVDVFIVVLQVVDDLMLEDNMISVNRINNYRGNNRDNFVSRIPSIIRQQWNI